MASLRRDIATAVAIAATVGVTAACGASSQTSEPDCASQLRFRGVTYTAYRVTHQHPTKVGFATPTCSGKPVADGHRVAVGAFPGHSPSNVLGRQSVDGRFAIYVADSVTPGERSRILAAVSIRH